MLDVTNLTLISDKDQEKMGVWLARKILIDVPLLSTYTSRYKKGDETNI